MQKNKIIITCARGIPLFLREEILSLGFPILSEGGSSVETEGTLEDTMKLNLHIRTGQRVLYLLEEFRAGNPDELHQKISEIAWEDYISEDGYFCVTSAVDTPTIRDSRYANVRCKDAMVDRFAERFGRRPDSGPERNYAVVHLYWQGRGCRIFLDTSGEPLSRRGYRKIPLKAPMQETLAAATVLATGWQGTGNFINPMCGSGTLAIEAAMIGLSRAPGLLRSNFGFMHLKGFNEAFWKMLRKKARSEARTSTQGEVIATDISSSAVQAARQNAATAGVDPVIEFRVCNFSETPVPAGGGVIILNPPYGERLGEMRELGETYQGIGDFFKKRGKGYKGYVFTGNPSLSKRIGLRTRRRIPFFNGDIECRLLEYDLYEGSRKHPSPHAVGA
jgi:23S rRNA G2445 N2-methylase RlmL